MANVIVSPMILQNRPKASSAQQSGTVDVGRTPTTKNLPRIADFGAPSSTHENPVARATCATDSGVSRAPTCKFHHPGCKRKPRVSTRFTPSNMLCPVMKPCTVMVRDTRKASLHNFGWVTRPHAKRGGCNHIGTATCRWHPHVWANPVHVPVPSLRPTCWMKAATSKGTQPKPSAVKAKAAKARSHAEATVPLQT